MPQHLTAVVCAVLTLGAVLWLLCAPTLGPPPTPSTALEQLRAAQRAWTQPR